MMQKIRWFLLVLGVTVALVTALWNNGPVTINFPFFHRELPLSLLILTSVACGFLLGAMTTYSMLRSHKKATPKLKKPSKSSEKEAATPPPDLTKEDTTKEFASDQPAAKP
ncbi:hypothetical protein CA13_21190 [Planctomycetes bacterium CA13]|uniref:Lipopolysaccharide assembly protein A domain-containing protein n=1 Tax=Novipirellula herctigrandis TaxID=2527986 RepID=A0A5C5Z246_9BACT|nr:hypothetical protein CA13_21190 [Planctomycetes bacterium CA13]